MDTVERKPSPVESEEYVVIGEGSPMSMDELTSIINYFKLDESISLEESVHHLCESSRQNIELSSELEQKCSMMHSYIQTTENQLAGWKTKWEDEREQVRQNNEQARQVVTELRADIAEKDAKIEQLNTKLEELTSERISAPVSDEKRELMELKQQVASLQKHLATYEEEKSSLTSTKDEVRRELDQHIKNVGVLQSEKQQLEEECHTLKSQAAAYSERMHDLKRKLEAVATEKTELSEHYEKLLSYSMVQEIGQTLSVVGGDNQAGAESSISTTISDLFTQLQELRGQNKELKSALSATNQEMATLQDKVHQGVEQLKQCEHKHRLALNQEEEQHQQTVAQLTYEMNNLRSSRSSSESSGPSVEEVKILKTRVGALGNECKAANAKLRDMEDLYTKQKERLKSMEHILHETTEEQCIEREKADDLIAKMHDSVRVLESALQEKQLENQRIGENLRESNVKFSQLYIDYHHSLQQLEELRSAFKALRNQVDEMTAQLMAGEESLAARAEQLEKVKQERDAALEEAEKFVQILPVIKAQSEVYKSDFEAEREARQKMHQDKETLAEENEYLHAEISRLKNELSAVSGAQLELMRNKHAKNRPNTRNQERPASTGPLQPQERPRRHICPICQKELPDYDSLQLHCQDCLN